jgi:putative endonuclease
VTGDLLGRVHQHRDKANAGFTNRYDAWKLVYFEHTAEVFSALEREKPDQGWLARFKGCVDREHEP